jgi:hypothetical protein
MWARVVRGDVGWAGRRVGFYGHCFIMIAIRNTNS